MSTDGGVCHVRLNRPDKMNALDPAMFEGITAALAELADDASIRVIVLSGEGKAFCAGLDLGSFGLSDDAPTDLVPRTHGKANGVQHLGWGWRQLSVPVISAVHGVCLGGGMQLMAGSILRSFIQRPVVRSWKCDGDSCPICPGIHCGEGTFATIFFAGLSTPTKCFPALRLRVWFCDRGQ